MASTQGLLILPALALNSGGRCLILVMWVAVLLAHKHIVLLDGIMNASNICQLSPHVLQLVR